MVLAVIISSEKQQFNASARTEINCGWDESQQTVLRINFRNKKGWWTGFRFRLEPPSPQVSQSFYSVLIVSDQLFFYFSLRFSILRTMGRRTPVIILEMAGCYESIKTQDMSGFTLRSLYSLWDYPSNRQSNIRNTISSFCFRGTSARAEILINYFKWIDPLNEDWNKPYMYFWKPQSNMILLPVKSTLTPRCGLYKTAGLMRFLLSCS